MNWRNCRFSGSYSNLRVPTRPDFLQGAQGRGAESPTSSGFKVWSDSSPLRDRAKNDRQHDISKSYVQFMRTRGGWVGSVTRTSRLDFGSVPDPDPAFQWEMKGKLFSLAEVRALQCGSRSSWYPLQVNCELFCLWLQSRLSAVMSLYSFSKFSCHFEVLVLWPLWVQTHLDDRHVAHEHLILAWPSFHFDLFVPFCIYTQGLVFIIHTWWSGFGVQKSITYCWVTGECFVIIIYCYGKCKSGTGILVFFWKHVDVLFCEHCCTFVHTVVLNLVLCILKLRNRIQ